MRNAGLEEAQAGIKIAGRNINSLRYSDDTTVMTESEEELKSLVMKVKEESEKVGLKLIIEKMKIMASGPHFTRTRPRDLAKVQALGRRAGVDCEDTAPPAGRIGHNHASEGPPCQ